MVVALLCIIPLSLAYNGNPFDDGVMLKARAMSVIMVSSILVTAVVILAIISRKLGNHKQMLFLLMLIPVVIATLYTAGTTIYLNQISVTRGPVHWHADLEVWNCGEKVNLIDPQGLSNRIGTPVFHEHDDFRIHVEGVVVKTEDVSLGNFFNVVGGTLTQDALQVPTNEGMMLSNDGDLCDGKPGKIQVFAYKIDNPEEQGSWIFTQQKIEDHSSYLLSPYSIVPPGDCIIIEFDQEKEKTDKICTTYQVAIDQGEVDGS